jgi:hypothetical protein
MENANTDLMEITVLCFILFQLVYVLFILYDFASQNQCGYCIIF